MNVGQIRLRKHYNATLLGIHRNELTLQTNLRGVAFKAGDTLVLYSAWKDLTQLAANRNFVVVSDYPENPLRPEKIRHALICFLLAMTLALFTDYKLAYSLLIGAAGMLISGVISMDEAYEAISWKTVFLLACLIPLGISVHTTGTGAWMAAQI